MSKENNMSYEEYWLFLIENLKKFNELRTKDCNNVKNCAIGNRQESCLYLAKFDTLIENKLEELELKSKILEEKEKELTERAKNLKLLKQHLDKILTTKN